MTSLARHREVFCVVDPTCNLVYSGSRITDHGQEPNWTEKIMKGIHFMSKDRAVETAQYVSAVTGKTLLIKNYDIITPV